MLNNNKTFSSADWEYTDKKIHEKQAIIDLFHGIAGKVQSFIVITPALHVVIPHKECSCVVSSNKINIDG